MQNQDQETAYRGRGNRPHFSKQVIRQIVQSIERGASRRELIARYGMSKGTLSDWVREYASHAYISSQKPLNPVDRRSLVRAIEQGLTIEDAKSAFNIPTTRIVKRYLQQAEKEKAELRLISTLMEKNEVRSEAISSEDTVALKKALEEAELKIKALNTLIDVAEDKFKIKIRKKPGAKQS
jgi:Transposase.